MTRQEAILAGLAYYFTGNPCKKGHVSKRRTSNHECWECGVDGYRRRARNAYLRNPEAYKRRASDYYYKNHEAEKLKRKNRRDRNKENLNSYFNQKYHSDVDYRIGVTCRRMVRRCLEYTGRRKKTSSFQILGYTQEQLKIAIEVKFQDGMNWENHGLWHIDHIRPIVDFVRNGIDDLSVINALDNLQPLWAEENIRKKDALGNT